MNMFCHHCWCNPTLSPLTVMQWQTKEAEAVTVIKLSIPSCFALLSCSIFIQTNFYVHQLDRSHSGPDWDYASWVAIGITTVSALHKYQDSDSWTLPASLCTVRLICCCKYCSVRFMKGAECGVTILTPECRSYLLKLPCYSQVRELRADIERFEVAWLLLLSWSVLFRGEPGCFAWKLIETVKI